MSDDKVFIDGMIFKAPHENAPDFVRGKISVKLKDFFEFAKQHQNDGWLNMEMKVSRNGKTYFELDTWKRDDQPAQKPAPQAAPADDGFDDSIPF